MADPFSTDEAEESSGTRPDFIGQVVRSEVNATEDRFSGGQYENDIDILYELKPLDKDWDNVYELGLNTAGSLGSKWMFLIGFLENIYGPDTVRNFESLEELTEFLDGKVFKITDFDFSTTDEVEFEYRQGGTTVIPAQLFADSDNPPNPMLLPLEEITDETELADLGVEGEVEAEETTL